MPRYYFHLRDADRLVEDELGMELSGPAEAKAFAEENARDVMAAKVKAGDILDGESIEVVDQVGEMVAVVALKSVLRLR